MEHLDELPLSMLMQSDMYPCFSAPYRSQERLKALAERTILTLFIGKEVNRKRLYESELFFAPHLDAHTTREAEEKMAEHSALKVEKLDEEAFNLLKSTLPGITNVRIVIGGKGNNEIPSQIMGRIIQLLEHWANKLETLGIWARFPFHWPLLDTGGYTDLFRPLFAVIKEKLTSLQYLTMAISGFLKELPLDVSFIGRLKLFSTDLPNELLLDSLNHYGALQEKLPEVRLFNNRILTEKTKSKLQEMPPRLALKITALNVQNPLKTMPTFFAHFPALKWCTVELYSRTYLSAIPHILNSLSVLPQLKYLQVSVWPSESSTDVYNSTNFLSPLPLLETLFIVAAIKSQHFFSYFEPLERRFPSLKWLHMSATLVPGMERTPKEFVSLCMHQFAQQQLKGSFQLWRSRPPYNYKEDFNFAEGRTFEDWQYKEENVEEQTEDTE